MEKKKQELIANLFHSGKITFEEAMELCSTDSLPMDNDEGEKENPVNIVAHEFFRTDRKGFDEPIFNYEKALEYYHKENWTWFNSNGPISAECLKDCVRSLIKNAIENLKGQIDDKVKDPETRVATGGLELEAYQDEDGDFVFTINFIPLTGTVFIDRDIIED